MNANVPYQRPPGRHANPGVVYTEGPPYVSTTSGAYTHRIRSAYVIDAASGPRTILDCWCGQVRYTNDRVTHELPTGQELCATCEGRALGAGQGSRVLNLAPDVQVMFRPRSGNCPASGSSRHSQPDGPHMWRIAVCDDCGTLCTLSSRGSAWDRTYVLSAHPAPVSPYPTAVVALDPNAPTEPTEPTEPDEPDERTEP